MPQPGPERVRALDGPAGEPDLTVSFAPHPAGLRVDVSGRNTLDNTLAYWTRVLHELRARPRPVLLVDRLAGPPLTAHDWGEVVEAMRGTSLAGVRIAHVRPGGLAALEHCELQAVDAGFDARVFVDEDEASRWLRFGEGTRLEARDAQGPADQATNARSNT